MRDFSLKADNLTRFREHAVRGKSNNMTARETLLIGQERASLPMTSLAMKLAMNAVDYFQGNRDATKEALVRAIFGTFMGGLIILLILLYAGAPIV